MDVVAGAVGQGLLDEVAAVGGGVHRDVAGTAAHAALQNGLEGGKVVVVGGKAQVVDEQDEFERVRGQFVHQIRDLVELVLLHFHQPQAFRCKLIGNGFHRTGLAGACIAVQQHIVGGHSGQQGFGVGNDLFPLLFVAGQLGKALGVRVFHRHQMAVLHREHMVLGKHAIALFSHFAHALGVGGRQVDAGGLPPGQESQLLRLPCGRTGSGQQFVQRQAAQSLQKSQFTVQRGLQCRGKGARCSLTYADGLGFQHSGAEVAAPVGGVLEQCGFKLGHSVAHRAIAGRTGFHAVGQVQKLCHNGVVQQAAENNKPVQPGIPFSQFHIPVL